MDRLTEGSNVRQLLVSSGDRLPASAREALRRQGSSAIPELIAVLSSEELDHEGSPGDGWATTHAARLLGELEAPEAVSALLGALARSRPLTLLRDAAILALQSVGPAALEPTLSALAATDDPELADNLRCVLADLGAQDDRVFAILVEALSGRVDSAASDLAAYGDARALPAVSAALDAYVLDVRPGPFADQAAVELAAAIRQLGGSLSPAQEEKLAKVSANRESVFGGLRAALSSPRSAKKPGRNEPCWCGSGDKYKRCHLGKADDGSAR